jgi:hypothetical protein
MKALRTEYCQWVEFDEASTSSRSHKSSVAYVLPSEEQEVGSREPYVHCLHIFVWAAATKVI